MNSGIAVREIGAEEFERVWPFFRDIVGRGDTYSYPPDLGFEQAQAMWTTPPARCFIAESDGETLGAYRLAPNQIGLGDHVANGSYMVSSAVRGRGIGSLLCKHSLEEARRSGYAAMQFNFVVSTNTGAVKLWQQHGFQIVGTLPKAFRHVQLGPVDAYVMFRQL